MINHLLEEEIRDQQSQIYSLREEISEKDNIISRQSSKIGILEDSLRMAQDNISQLEGENYRLKAENRHRKEQDNWSKVTGLKGF